MRHLILILALAPNAFCSGLTALWSEVDFQASLFTYAVLNGVSDSNAFISDPATFQNYLNKLSNTEIETLVEEPLGFGLIRNFGSALVNLDGVAEVGVGAASFGEASVFTTFEWLLVNTNTLRPTETLTLTLNIPESSVSIYNGLGYNPGGDTAPEAEVEARLRWFGSTIEQPADSETIFGLATTVRAMSQRLKEMDIKPGAFSRSATRSKGAIGATHLQSALTLARSPLVER